ncbi:hypothetical protein D5086_031860 [Populus alba]|uniref:Uncharacterized protein n=1 Tax=Populus alba TaxID=43335 RepID=A0ACC4AJU5_POPAL
MQKTHSSASCDNKGISSSGFRAGSSTSTKRAGSTPSASNPPSSPLQSTTTPRGSGSPSANMVANEKQQPYSQGLHVDTPIDPMSTKAAIFEIRRHSSPGHKQTKLVASSIPKQASKPALCPEYCEDLPILPVKRQYLTRSKASNMVTQPSLGKPGTTKRLVTVHCSYDDLAP